MSRKRSKKVDRGHLVPHRRDESKEQEILHSEMYKDPSVQSIFAQMPNASETEALELALRLQKIIRGKASLLDSPEQADTLNAMRKDAAERDAVAAAYEANKQAFIDEIFDKTEGKKLTGAKAEDAKKRVMNALEIARANSKANRALRRRRLEEELRLAPKEEIYVSGEVQIVRVGKGLVPKIFPEEIQIGHVKFVLAPGKHTVPKQVADIHRQRLLSKSESEGRKNMLSVDHIDIDRNVAKRWNQDKYTKAEPFPIGTGIAGG
jgi:hypothetical protein